jgi:hypothetical protein
MEQRIERSKVVARWIIAAVLLVGVVYLKRQHAIPVTWPMIALLTAAVAALNVVYWSLLRRSAPRWLKYVTTGTDLALISLLVGYSGGSTSVFYVAYFVVLVSNSIRYGIGMALYVATIYNIAYVIVLVINPPPDTLTLEAAKILAFWGVALYAGYLAMRFQRQERILESYEETITQLRTEIGTLRAGK